MATASKKRPSEDIDPEQKIAENANAPKKASPVSGPSWSLGKSKGGERLAYVDSFKGSTLVSFREFYTGPDGQLKPGSKGISLSVDQFKALRACWDDLCNAVDEKAGE
jgi:hypothetical protein